VLRRPSLRPQLNQIRLWVRQGRTDAWIAHKLDVPIEQLNQFKREQGLDVEPSKEPESALEPESATAPEPERVDEDLGDLGIHEPEAHDELEELERGPAPEETAVDEEDELPLHLDARLETSDEDDAEPVRPPRRRRGRRGGRRRSARAGDALRLEGTFDHGDEGYGLWLDPAIADSDVYSRHWAGQRAVEVTVDADAITIRRARTAGADERLRDDDITES
jgi:hypothetical protein